MNINSILSLQGQGLSVSTGKSEQLKKDPREEFLAYMEKSPAERMADAWLKAHGLSEEDLKAMDPAKREAIEKQMAEDIKREMQEEAQKRALKQANNKTLPMASFLVVAGEQS
ncbi:hypothetical protein [Dongia sp.]|uniref:hypothetical protein n=1 Tax=Dongia sp. TaxID=1977262 RepID=UPI0035B123D4